MYCKYCGQKIEDGFRFCMNCGKPIEVPAAPAQEKIGPVIPVAPVVPVPVPVKAEESEQTPQLKADAGADFAEKAILRETEPKLDNDAGSYLEKQAQEAAQTLSDTVTYEMSEETGKVITAVGNEEKGPAQPEIPQAPAPQPEYTVFADPASIPAAPPQPVAPAPVQPAAPPQPVPPPQPAFVQPPVPPARSVTPPQQPYVQQPYVQQPYVQQPYVPQQPYVQQPYVQERYVPVQPVAPQVVVAPQPVVMTPPVKAEPEKPGNGQAVAGIVFGVLAFIFLAIAAGLLSQFSTVDDFMYRSDEALIGSILGGGMTLGLGSVLYLFNFIFGLIGFIKGLKHKSKIAAGVVAFVLLLINLVLLIVALSFFPRMMALAASV